jgi:hypothetical protein
VASPSLVNRNSQIVYDQTTGKHSLLVEDTVAERKGRNHLKTFSKISVESTGKQFLKHDLRVAGKLNFRDRNRFASDTNESILSVQSPESLLLKSVEKLYVPQ